MAVTASDQGGGVAFGRQQHPAEDGSFILSATVSNTGAGGSLATTLRYYRSTGDTQVGTGAVGALASGDEASSIDLTTPSTPGVYYYGACVDAASGE